jgi:hypothetical protein
MRILRDQGRHAVPHVLRAGSQCHDMPHIVMHVGFTGLSHFGRFGIEFGATSARIFTDIFKHSTTFDWSERPCCEEESGNQAQQNIQIL